MRFPSTRLLNGWTARRVASILIGTLVGVGVRAQTVVQVDDDRYDAAIVGFQTFTDATGIRHGYLTLRLHNLGKTPLTLAADTIQGAATDENGTRYQGSFGGAVGNFYTGSVDARFVLPPGGTAEALLDLYTLDRLSSPPGTTFLVKLPIANVGQDAKGKTVVGPKYLVQISDLTTAEFAPKADNVSSGDPRGVAEPFAARITSATVAPAPDHRGIALVMTVAVTNLTPSPLLLALSRNATFAIDEHAQTYAAGGMDGADWALMGIPDTSIYDVPPRFTMLPGETRSFTVSVYRRGVDIPMEERLGVYLGLSTLAKAADSKYHRSQDYRLSFLYVRPTARSMKPIKRPNDP